MMGFSYVYSCFLLTLFILFSGTQCASRERREFTDLDLTSSNTESIELSKKNLRSSNETVDPHRVVSYEDMLEIIHQPEKMIIDVRTRMEVHATGRIPSSINIPLSTLQFALTSMSDDEFKENYQRSKPGLSDELIFYCVTGRRATEALDKALNLGYSNSKVYLGSWREWSSMQQ